MKKTILYLLVAVVLTGNIIAGPNLIVNGGFEQPSIKNLPGPWGNGWQTNFICIGSDYSLDYPNLNVPGWQVAGEIDVMKDNITLISSSAAVRSEEGEQFLDLDGRMPGTITQVVPVTAGKKYRFQYNYACYSAASMSVTVLSSNGNTLYSNAISATPNGANAPLWSLVSTNITALDNSLTVRFTSTSRVLGMSGLILDNVGLYQIEPVMIYAFNSSVRDFSNNKKSVSSSSGFFLSDDVNNQYAFITLIKNKKFYLTTNNTIDSQSTGARVGDIKLYSQAISYGTFPNNEKDIIWFLGANSYNILNKTKSIVAPKNMTGFMNLLTLEGNPVIETQNINFTLDAKNTLTSLTNNESISDSITRFSNNLIRQGYQIITQP
jgi:hypothetical protein